MGSRISPTGLKPRASLWVEKCWGREGSDEETYESVYVTLGNAMWGPE